MMFGMKPTRLAQYRWRIEVLLKRIAAIPGKAVEAFQRGYDRKREEQWNGPSPPAEGLEIRTNGVAPEAMAQTASAVRTLIEVVPNSADGVDLWRLNQALDRLTIEWVEHEVHEHRALHRRGHRWLVRAQWMGSVWESRLFHTLLHFINMSVRIEQVRHDDRNLFVKHDMDHSEVEYWGLEMLLCQRERD